MSLLPQDHSEFRSKQYWDDFFRKRENVAFEWYGDYHELVGHITSTFKKDDNVLVIGCGNSNFSSDFYDQGYHNVTNLDFSELVIEEMVAKNLGRDKMTWDVGDMTNLSKYGNNSFDIVFDKGALDALMSTDSEQSREMAKRMFDEITRVLKPNGKYVCITLAERFIIETLLHHYTSVETVGFAINVDCVVSKKESPFVPFYVEISKVSAGSSVSNSKIIRLHLDQFGNRTSTTNKLSVACIGALAAIEELTQLQNFHQKQYQISKLEVGRFEKLQFWSDAHLEIPRFTIFLLDNTTAASATLGMAVFMVPVGRESDFQFTTTEGLKNIADQANCKRLLAVCCNRPHVYPEMKALQDELNPIVLSLKFKGMSAEQTIPYMAINAESDWETIETGVSPESGDYIIEESFDEDHPSAILRRLIFLQNQNFIQTEVRLLPSKTKSAAAKPTKGKKKPAKKAAKGAGKNDEEGSWEFDYSFLDAHHRAALCALSMLPSVVNGAHKVQNPAVTASVTQDVNGLLIGLGGGALPMCLQRYLPNLHLWMCDLDSSVDSVAREYFGFKCNTRSTSFVADGLVVLDSLFSQLHPTSTAASAVQAVVPESLLAAQRLDVLFIDADSKDTTLGISAPPAAFLTLRTLVMMYSVLKPGGAVYFNVVARNKTMLVQLVAKLSAVFNVVPSKAAKGPEKALRSEADAEVSAVRSELLGTGCEVLPHGRIYHIQASKETMNEGLLVIKGAADSASACAGGKPVGGSKVAECYEREALLEFWLKVKLLFFVFLLLLPYCACCCCMLQWPPRSLSAMLCINLYSCVHHPCFFSIHH